MRMIEMRKEKTLLRRTRASALRTLGLLAFGATSLAPVARASVPTDPGEVEPLPEGAEVPEVVVRDGSGRKVPLAEILAGKPTLLVFYRGGWCPYCNRQLQGLKDIEPELLDLGVRIVGISPDRPGKLNTVDGPPLPYRLFSDASMKATTAFGIAYRVSDSTYGKLRSAGIDIEEASGREHRLLPVPAVFLVDHSGRIAFRSFNPDYTVRIAPDELLQQARKLFLKTTARTQTPPDFR